MHQYPLTPYPAVDLPFPVAEQAPRTWYRCERCGEWFSEAYPTEMDEAPCDAQENP